MSVVIRVTKSFIASVKPLLRKYPSLSKDLLQLERDLSGNPKQGTSLGHNAYKIRLKISSSLGLDLLKKAYQTKSNQIKGNGDILSDPSSDLFLGVIRKLESFANEVERDF